MNIYQSKYQLGKVEHYLVLSVFLVHFMHLLYLVVQVSVPAVVHHDDKLLGVRLVRVDVLGNEFAVKLLEDICLQFNCQPVLFAHFLHHDVLCDVEGVHLLVPDPDKDRLAECAHSNFLYLFIDFFVGKGWFGNVHLFELLHAHGAHLLLLFLLLLLVLFEALDTENVSAFSLDELRLA